MNPPKIYNRAGIPYVLKAKKVDFKDKPIRICTHFAKTRLPSHVKT